jgi:hypothetical protein
MGCFISAQVGRTAATKLGIFATFTFAAQTVSDFLEWAEAQIESVKVQVEELLEEYSEIAGFLQELPAKCWLALMLLVWYWLGGKSEDVPAAVPVVPSRPPPAPPAPTVHFSSPARAVESDETDLKLLDEQRRLRRRIAELEEAPPPAVSGETGGPPDPSGATSSAGDPLNPRLELMMKRLESMEEVLRKDSGSPPPLPPVGSHGGDCDELIAELERASQNVHSSFLKQLRRYREVHPWPMPAGYRKRLAPTYLAGVYKNGISGVEYGRRWIAAHKLEKCSLAQEILSILEAIDDSILTDERDVINSVAFEKLCRRAYGLERAFENEWSEDDYKHPDSQKGKNWKSKVQWDLCEQFDVRSLALKATRVPEAEAEARESMEREASFNKYYAKLSASRSSE